jgi:hypothetical protein
MRGMASVRRVCDGGWRHARVQRSGDTFVNSHGPTVHVRNFRRRHVFVRREESEWPLRSLAIQQLMCCGRGAVRPTKGWMYEIDEFSP